MAKKFFSSESGVAVLAYAANYPDGLTGGSLAMSIDAPLLLVDSWNYTETALYVKKNGVEKIAVIGGTGVIPDSLTKKILN